MNLTIKQAVESIAALRRLSEQTFPVKLSYKLGRVLTGIEREIVRFEKHRVQLIKKYGENVEGEQWRIDPKSETFEAFSLEYEELLSIEFKTWGDPVSLDELGELSISPADLASLDWLILEPVEQPEQVTEQSEPEKAETANV